MTVTEDRTDALLDGDQAPVSDGSVLEIVQLLEEAIAEQREYAAMFRELATPTGVLKYFRHLSTADQQIVLSESGVTDQHGLEIARARSEVIQQVCAQLLSKTEPDLVRELLGPFWREPS